MESLEEQQLGPQFLGRGKDGWSKHLLCEPSLPNPFGIIERRVLGPQYNGRDKDGWLENLPCVPSLPTPGYFRNKPSLWVRTVGL